MKTKPIFKVLAIALSVMMLFSVIPMSVFAATPNYAEGDDDYYKVVSKKDWELAPGVTESEIVINNINGTRRQVAHVVEIDINNEYTKVIPSYKGMVPVAGSYSVQDMVAQAAYAEANGYGNVVAAMNISLSWYDSAYYIKNPHLVGEPLGYMILDGVQYTNSQGKTAGAQSCLVINFDEKDGVARPADIPKTQVRSTSSPITGWEEQVIPANFGFLVKDGKMVNTSVSHTNGDPRSMLGIKADGSIIMVMNDGRQAPYSSGFTEYEMSEFMLKMGCIHAINGDGGGSSQFLSQRPGEELELHCYPSEGALRPTTHGVLVISTAPATGEFVRATIEADDKYYTPGSSVQFTAVGSDLVGTPADIPADAVWQLSDPTMGTIQDGLFVSNGKVGTATAQLVYKGNVVGESSIEIVIPEKIAFTQSAIVVPFGKTAQFTVKATINDGVHEVITKLGDITLSLDNNGIGFLDGINFTFSAIAEDAAPSNLKGTLTATMHHGDGLVITVPFSVGKGSDIVYDFEDKDLTGWSIYTNYGKYGPLGPNGKVTDSNGNYWYHGQNERGYISIVDESTGKVRNGKYALAVECDFSQLYETGYHALNLKFPLIDCKDSLQIGFWLYIPYDARHAEINYGASNIGNGQFYEFNEGWHYITGIAKDNQFYYINISIDDRAPVSAYNNYDYINEPNLGGKFTFYIDDITVDYSTAVEDRENPVFQNVEIIGNDSNTALNGKLVTTTNNTPSFEVKVADDTTLGNSTGLNAKSAVAYIDGKKVDCTFVNGRITISNYKLSDGIHNIRFEIADNAGNSSWAGGKINVSTGADDSSTIKVVPKNPNIYRPLIGSLYWMDVVATDIETIDKVEMVFDLNDDSTWELEGIEVAEGFEATYSIQKDDNIATLILTRVGENNQTGETVIASFPVRTWESTLTQYEGYEDQTPAKLVARGIVWKKAIELALQRGVITYVKDYKPTTTGTFSMGDLVVDTEIFFTNYTRASVAGAQDWLNAKRAAGIGWHEHTATAIEKDATCTESGYIGRTYCKVCDSVIEWGTTLPASGHNWTINAEGKLACANTGNLFTGVYTDGKEYINGVVVLDGWFKVNGVNTYYYKNGVKLTGSNFIDGIMCTFDDNGTYLPQYKYSGFYNINNTIMFFEANEYVTGFYWTQGNHYSFDKNGMGYDGEYVINGTKCLFNDGLFVAADGVLMAGVCGEDAYYILYENGTLVIDGSGAMVDFTGVGAVPWYAGEYRYNINKIVIGKGITHIGKRAFINTYATEVVFEENSKLAEIDDHAFSTMRELTSITLPLGVETIGMNAFHLCTKLEDIYLPASVTDISSSAFTESDSVLLHVAEGSFIIDKIQRLKLSYVTYAYDGLAWQGACGENARWELYNNGVLKITGSGAMTDYAAAGAPWYKYRSKIESIEISKDITTVGAFSFYMCSNLKTVTFEKGSVLQSINKGSFGYTSIVEITIPATVTVIGDHAFYNCYSLETVSFEADSQLSVIMTCAFLNDTALKNVYIPDRVVTVEKIAFLNTGSVVLSVAEGGAAHQYAVRENIAFTTRVVAPFVKYEGTCGDNAKWELYSNGVLKITGSGAMTDYAATAAPWYKYSNEITTVEISKDITTIGAFSFYMCSNLKTVTFEKGSVLQSINKGSFGYTSIVEITIPATVTVIGDHAFYNCYSLETVSFEADSQLSVIMTCAFLNDTALKNVYIPDRVVTVEKIAFLNTGSVVLSVAEGGAAHQYAVRENIAFTTRVVAPFVKYEGTCGDNAKWELYSNGVLKITGSGAMTDYAATAAPWYKYSNEITTVEIGKDITTIGAFSFYYLTNLKTAIFAENGSLKAINKGAFGYTGLETITIPATVEIIADHAFYFMADLTTVNFAQGSQLTSIGAYAFRNDTALKNVFIPDRVTFIGTQAFFSTGSVVLSVAEGGAAHQYAVRENIAFTTRVVAPFVKYEGTCGDNAKWELYSNGVLKITGSGAMTDYAATAAPWYKYSNEITTVEISKDITTIGAFSFYMCSNLKTVTFEKGSVLQSINKGSFGYTSIVEITIPATVTVIGDHAFYNCYSLETVSFEADSQLSVIMTCAFLNDTALKNVYIPDRVVTVEKIAFINTGSVVLSVAEGGAAHQYAVRENIAFTTRVVAPFVKYEGTCGDNAKWELYSNGVLKITGSGAMTDYAATAAPWYKYSNEITTVEISKDITTIGAFSFYMCSNLKTVTFEKGSVLQSINKGSFGYTSIVEITIPATVTVIGDHAFYNCYSLETVSFEADSQLSVIMTCAFLNDTALKNVYIPDRVVTVEKIAFLNTGSVVLSVAEGGAAHQYAVRENIAFTTRVVAPFVKYEGTCGDNAKWELYSNGVLKITGSGAMTDYAATAAPWYKYSNEITTVEIGKDITTIGAFSFYYLTNLKTAIFAENGSLKAINKGAFGYTGLETITIPATVEIIADHAFYFMADLTTVNFAQGSQLESIGEYAFRATTALNAVNGIPANTTINKYAFFGSAYTLN